MELHLQCLTPKCSTLNCEQREARKKSSIHLYHRRAIVHDEGSSDPTTMKEGSRGEFKKQAGEASKED